MFCFINSVNQPQSNFKKQNKCSFSIFMFSPVPRISPAWSVFFLAYPYFCSKIKKWWIYHSMVNTVIFFYYVQDVLLCTYIVLNTLCYVKVLVTQLCPTLWDIMDCHLLGSSVHRILQAEILEWVASPFFMGSSWPRDRTQIRIRIEIGSKLQADSLPSEPPGTILCT